MRGRGVPEVEFSSQLPAVHSMVACSDGGQGFAKEQRDEPSGYPGFVG